MFKFIKQYAETMENAQIYPVLSLLIFFIFFVVLLVYVKKLDRSSVDTISRIPLDSTPENKNNAI